MTRLTYTNKIYNSKNTQSIEVCTLKTLQVCTIQDGKVYWWGKRLVPIPDKEDHIKEPTLLNTATHKIAQISVGSNHCVLLTTEGAVLTWGYNDKGQLG